MNNLEQNIQKLKQGDNLWVKYYKKGKIFARHGVFSTYDDNVLTIIASSLRKTGKIMLSNISIAKQDIIFIGNTDTNERIYINKNCVEDLQCEN